MLKLQLYVDKFDRWVLLHGIKGSQLQKVEQLSWPVGLESSLPKRLSRENSVAHGQSVEESMESKIARRKENWRVVHFIFTNQLT